MFFFQKKFYTYEQLHQVFIDNNYDLIISKTKEKNEIKICIRVFAKRRRYVIIR